MVPEVVTNRMLKRIVLFMGVPVMTGMLLLPGFYYLKVVQGLDIPTYVVYTVQSFTFGAGTQCFAGSRRLTRTSHPRAAWHQLWDIVDELGPAERRQRVGCDRVQGQLAHCVGPVSALVMRQSLFST